MKRCIPAAKFELEGWIGSFLPLLKIFIFRFLTYSKGTIFAFVYTYVPTPQIKVWNYSNTPCASPQSVLHPPIPITTFLSSITIDPFCLFLNFI